MKHTLSGTWETRTVLLNGKPIDPRESLKVRNHSPDGFNWGYSGSGPSQLVLAVMLKLTGKSDNYQEFKFKVIAALPQSDFKCEFDIETFNFRIL